MKTLTKFQAIDGVEFYDEAECIEYESLINKIDKIISQLPPLPKDDGCKFANGGGFIQHDKNTLRSVKLNLLEEIKKHIEHRWIQQTIDDDNIHPSYVGRLVDDHGIRPINNAWHRFMCIDKLGREWGQPYYANNPDKGEQVCIFPHIDKIKSDKDAN